MKLTIVGIEISEGTSRKTGRAYAIGTIHTTTKLAPPMGEFNVAKGHAGDRYDCDVNVLRKIEHLSFPMVAEADVQSQIRFGERVQYVADLAPLELVKKTA